MAVTCRRGEIARGTWVAATRPEEREESHSSKLACKEWLSPSRSGVACEKDAQAAYSGGIVHWLDWLELCLDCHHSI